MIGKYLRFVGLCLLLFLAKPGFCFLENQSDSLYKEDLKTLNKKIANVLKDHHGLCAGIALISKNHPDMILKIGNSESNGESPASENTIFRIASVSKMIVALAILKLQEEGKLSLEDQLKNIIPEVEFENPWEETHPIQVVHLLEHTSGWDEIHLVEMMYDETPPIPLKKALEFHPHTRKSRWVPGSRMTYSNVNYAVAAYIVEKVSGMSYEEYVRKAIFKPLMMSHSTFFNDRLYKEWGAVTYNWAMEKIPYKNELYRSPGGLNSSAGDMAQILKMLLNRGKIDSLDFLQEESIIRMETPKSSIGAQAGLELGYGLGNWKSSYKGFTTQGHDGAMNGGLSQLIYFPEYCIGHVILLNANNGWVMQQITALIRDFEMNLLPDDQSISQKYNGLLEIEEGYYLAINPRSQNRFYQDIFISIEKIEAQNNVVKRSWIGSGQTTSYYPVSPTQCILSNSNKIGLVLAEDPLAGKVLYSENFILKPVSTFQVYTQMILLGLWITLMPAGLLCFLAFTIAVFVKRNKYQTLLWQNLFPTLASIFFILMMFLQFYGFENTDMLLAKPSWLSLTLLVCSLLFALCSGIAIVVFIRSRNGSVFKLIQYSIFMLTTLHILAVIYLIYFGIIPLITWA